MNLTSSEILEALRASDDDALVGLEESTEFDAKSQPYRIDEPKGRWELAKDVSAMANARGGLLLVGAKTRRLEGSFVEQVASIDPIPTNLLKEEGIRNALKHLLFPNIGSHVELHRFDREAGRALLVIEVNPVPDDDRPVMVTTPATVDVDGVTHQVEAWAIATRVGSGTEWDQGAKVWSDIRDGRLARRNLTLRAPAIDEGPAPAARLDERVRDLVERTGAAGSACWILAAHPPRAVRLDGFYGDDGMFGALRRLPDNALRRSGFGLGYGLEVESLDDGLAVVETGRRSIFVGPDGLAVAVAVGSPNMLGWTGGNEDPLKLSPFVLTEWPLEFTRFVHRNLLTAQPGTPWTYTTRADRLLSGTPAVNLNFGPDFFDGRVPRTDSARAEFPAIEPETDAFALEAWFAGLFGFTETDLPWAVEGRIPTEAILAWK